MIIADCGNHWQNVADLKVVEFLIYCGSPTISSLIFEFQHTSLHRDGVGKTVDEDIWNLCTWTPSAVIFFLICFPIAVLSVWPFFHPRIRYIEIPLWKNSKLKFQSNSKELKIDTTVWYGLKLGIISPNGKIAFPINIPMSHNDLFYTEQKDINGDNFCFIKA